MYGDVMKSFETLESHTRNTPISFLLLLGDYTCLRQRRAVIIFTLGAYI